MFLKNAKKEQAYVRHNIKLQKHEFEFSWT